MTAVGFGLLSAVIGLVIFGSAMALGFQSSTLIAPFGGFSAEPSEVSMRESSVSYLAAEDSGETSGMAVPAVLKGSISAPPLPRSAGGGLSSDERLAFGGVSTGADRAAIKGSARFKPISVPARNASGAASTMASDTRDTAPAAGASDPAVPLTGAITDGTAAKRKDRTAFETSTPIQLGDGGEGLEGDTVVFEYPIPPIQPNSELELGEDPLTTAALEVSEGMRRPLETGFALLAPGAATAAAAQPNAQSGPGTGSLWSGDFVLSFNLSDDQLMLVLMVTGLISVAAFLWLASSWLGDRSTLKRQKEWERQQAAALAEAEEADAAANGAGGRVAA